MFWNYFNSKEFAIYIRHHIWHFNTHLTIIKSLSAISQLIGVLQWAIEASINTVFIRKLYTLYTKLSTSFFVYQINSRYSHISLIRCIVHSTDFDTHKHRSQIKHLYKTHTFFESWFRIDKRKRERESDLNYHIQLIQ